MRLEVVFSNSQWYHRRNESSGCYCEVVLTVVTVRSEFLSRDNSGESKINSTLLLKVFKTLSDIHRGRGTSTVYTVRS